MHWKLAPEVVARGHVYTFPLSVQVEVTEIGEVHEPALAGL